MAKRDYYDVLGVEQGRLGGRHQEGLPQEGDGAPSRPQPARPEERGALQGGQRGLRRPEGRAEEGGLRPLRPRRLRERRTAPAPAGSAPGQGGLRLGLLGRLRRPLRRLHGRGGRGAGARAAGGAGLGPALQPAAEARGGLPRQAGDDQRAVERGLRGLPRHRRRGRRGARHLPDLLGARQGAGAAGLLHRRADLPDLRRPRPDHQEPLHGLRRRRAGAQGPHAQRQHPGRGGDRHAHPAGRRGRGGAARRAGGRSLHLHRGRERTRSSSATTRTSTAASRSR